MRPNPVSVMCKVLRSDPCAGDGGNNLIYISDGSDLAGSRCDRRRLPPPLVVGWRYIFVAKSK